MYDKIKDLGKLGNATRNGQKHKEEARNATLDAVNTKIFKSLREGRANMEKKLKSMATGQDTALDEVQETINAEGEDCCAALFKAAA